jgi:hypothetical protein
MSIPSLRTAKSNRILGALPRAALERIIPDLELKTLEMRQVVQPRRQRLKEVIFPIVGVASMISMGDSGASVIARHCQPASGVNVGWVVMLKPCVPSRPSP